MSSPNKAWQIASAGQLELNDIGPPPTPDPTQVLVRIRAAALNYRDILVTDHSPDYSLLAKPNLIPASDGAGVIEVAGSASHWNKGDRVVLIPNTWLSGDPRNYVFDQTLGGASMDGTLQRYMVLDEQYVVRAPENMTLPEASTIHTAGVTAWNALNYGEPKVGPGVTVLTQGTGGVSCYAIQIAAAAGATVIATSSSDEKLEIAKNLGATHLINYRKTPDWSSEALKFTDGVGVDIVVDVVGGVDIAHSIKSLRYGGRITLVGLLGEDQPIKITQPLLYGAKKIEGRLGAGSRQMCVELCEFAEKHKIHPPIAQTFKFEEADQALAALRKFSGVGKIVAEV